MQESKFLGKILPAVPNFVDILRDIRRKYKIQKFSPGVDSQLKPQNVGIDWIAVRKDLEIEIRKIPDFLPPELAEVQKILAAQKTLPPEPVFDEPITDKLKHDVTILYHGFVNLYNFVSNNIAPLQTVIDKIYSTIADNLLHFLKTGEAKEVPDDWISNVATLPFFGEEVVLVMAGSLADPDEIMKQFREHFAKTFGKHRKKITNKHIGVADQLRKKLEGMALIDIADDEIQEHHLEYPSDPEKPEYRLEKRKLEDRIKHNMQRAWKIFISRLGDKK